MGDRGRIRGLQVCSCLCSSIKSAASSCWQTSLCGGTWPVEEDDHRLTQLFCYDCNVMCVRQLDLQKKVFSDLDHHAMDCPPWEAHVPLLITAIVRKFANARLAHLGKTFTDKTMGAASAKRSEKSRLLIFQHV